MTTIDAPTHEREQDFYSQLITEIEAGNIEHAVDMVITLPSRNQQFGTLFALARDIDHDFGQHEEHLNFELNHAIAVALARSLTLDRTLGVNLNLDLARILDISLDRSHVRNLAYNFTRAILINKAIIGCLEVLTVRSGNSASQPSSKNVYLEKPYGNFQITITGIDTLTPHNLANLVSPYLQALFELQHIISDLKGEAFSKPRIVSISQNSPVNVEVTEIPAALDALWRLISPAYRKMARDRAKLELEEKEADIVLIKAQVEQIQTQIDMPSVEVNPEYKKEQLEDNFMNLKRILEQNA